MISVEEHDRQKEIIETLDLLKAVLFENPHLTLGELLFNSCGDELGQSSDAVVRSDVKEFWDLLY